MGLLFFMSHEYIQSGTGMSDIEKRWIASIKNDRKRPSKKPIEKPIECPSEYTSWYSRTTEQKLKNAERQKDFLFERYIGLKLSELIRFSNGMDIPKSLETVVSTYRSAYQSKIDEIIELRREYYCENDVRETQAIFEHLEAEGEIINAESTNS